MLTNAVNRLIATLCLVRDTLADELEFAADVIAYRLSTGGRIWIIGNGGSQAQASHWSAELLGRLKRNRPPIPAVALGQDAAVTTCIANDWDAEEIFDRQVQALVGGRDVLWAISTSGASKNVLRAILAAREVGAFVVGFTGKNGMGLPCDRELRVPSADTATVQEVHEVLGHELCRAIEARVFKVVGE